MDAPCTEIIHAAQNTEKTAMAPEKSDCPLRDPAWPEAVLAWSVMDGQNSVLSTITVIFLLPLKVRFRICSRNNVV
jgi:hypothetical protein